MLTKGPTFTHLSLTFALTSLTFTLPDVLTMQRQRFPFDAFSTFDYLSASTTAIGQLNELELPAVK
jgi:hypothetical protein